MKLVIVESPAKCKKIAGFLGPGFTVLATMGHIRRLEQDLDALGLDSGFNIRYTFMKEKSSTMDAIIRAAKGASTIYLCADDDREGEAIAYSVACLLKKDPASLPRSVFHEITEKAVTTAIANPRRIDMNKVYAQQARSVLDMMIGFTISPILWKFLAKGLSAGRCQTPALRLVNDRECVIETHVSASSWILKMNLTGNIPGILEEELEDEESVLNYLENVHTSKCATVYSVKDTAWSSAPPKPLITSTLQQEVSALYSLNPKATMQIAQKLYEAGHITYMRTDNPVISEEAVATAHAFIEKTYGKNYVGIAASAAAPGSTSISKKGAGAGAGAVAAAGEAHEAIRPTHMEVKEIHGESALENKVYAFIWKRSIQSTMAAATGTKRVVRYHLDSDPDKFSWASTKLKTLFQGWKILGKQVSIDSDEETDAAEHADIDIDSIKEGQKIQWKEITSIPKHTAPSPRFTQATLVRELEKCGIGRPSTFASLIDVLLEKEYVEVYDSPGVTQKYTVFVVHPGKWPPISEIREHKVGVDKKKLKPTKLGKSVIDLCVKEFNNLFEYSFTSKMEERLDLIAKGDDSWKQVCTDIWNSYKDIYLRLKDSHSMPSKSEKVCDLGEGYKAVLSKNVPLLLVNKVFTPLPEGTVIQDLTLDDAKRIIAEHEAGISLGNYDGQALKKKDGPYGEYIQWKEVKIPFLPGETIDKTVERLEKKSNVQKCGEYIFAVGQYGPYMYKAGLKKKLFVSIPPGIDTSKLSPQAAKELYAKGCAAKKGK